MSTFRDGSRNHKMSCDFEINAVITNYNEIKSCAAIQKAVNGEIPNEKDLNTLEAQINIARNTLLKYEICMAISKIFWADENAYLAFHTIDKDYLCLLLSGQTLSKSLKVNKIIHINYLNGKTIVQLCKDKNSYNHRDNKSRKQEDVKNIKKLINNMNGSNPTPNEAYKNGDDLNSNNNDKKVIDSDKKVVDSPNDKKVVDSPNDKKVVDSPKTKDIDSPKTKDVDTDNKTNGIASNSNSPNTVKKSWADPVTDADD